MTLTFKIQKRDGIPHGFSKGDGVNLRFLNGDGLQNSGGCDLPNPTPILAPLPTIT